MNFLKEQWKVSSKKINNREGGGGGVRVNSQLLVDLMELSKPGLPTLAIDCIFQSDLY